MTVPDWQIEHGLRLADGKAQHFDDGTWVLAGRRTVRDGARAMLLIAPGLFRLDVRMAQDTYALSLRNLSGVEPTRHADVVAERTLTGPDGATMRESELAFGWDQPGGRDVRVLVRITPWDGELELPVIALGFLGAERA